MIDPTRWNKDQILAEREHRNGDSSGSETHHIVVEDVEFVPGFKRNLLSYVSLEKKGVRLRYGNEKRYPVSKHGTKMAGAHSEGYVLVVRGELSGALANAVFVHSVVVLKNTCPTPSMTAYCAIGRHFWPPILRRE